MFQKSLSEPFFRSNIYRLISKGFRYPSPQIFKTFHDGEFLIELWDNISQLRHLEPLMNMKNGMITRIESHLRETTYEDFEAKYVESFDVGTSVCSPYEGFYRKEPRPTIMVEVSEFYRYFGLLMNLKEGRRELPDHICAELEFMHFLSFKEGDNLRCGKDKNINGALLAQKDFLERHLIRWVPKFYGKLLSSAQSPFYIQLTEITSLFLTCELELLNEKIEAL